MTAGREKLNKIKGCHLGAFDDNPYPYKLAE